jgi:2-methylcitrate dehydratase PrpD
VIAGGWEADDQKEPAMPYLTHLLADHALSINVDTLPGHVRETTLCCILDLLGAAIAGTGSSAPMAACATSDLLYGSGRAPAWFTGQTSCLLSALLHNALLASALDLDDGNRAARGHPGASVIPTVLTLAALMPEVSGPDILSAVIAGYDVGVRIAAAQQVQAIPTRQTGRWAAFASAAAAGRLLSLQPGHLAEALAIAGVLAPNQEANGSSGYSRVTGNLVKEGIAFSAQTGLQAALLASAGFTGPADLLDHDRYYQRDRILAALGSRFEITHTYFKPYACCRYIHPALDAFLGLRGTHGFSSCEIDRIEVHAFHFALRLANSTDPANLVALQYSLPYCLAVLALCDEAALAPVSPDLLHRVDITDLARRVELHDDAEAEARFPDQTCAKLVVFLRSGKRLATPMTGARGDPANPMDRQAIEAKFRSVAASRFPATTLDKLVRAVDLLGEGKGLPLLSLLQDLKSEREAPACQHHRDGA